MNVLDAAYHTVHDYEGGAQALASRMGKAPGTLCHEVRPPIGSTAKLGLLDAMKLMDFSRDHRIMHAMASQLGGMFVPLGGVNIEGHDALHLAEVAREFAELMSVVARSSVDGRITDNELSQIQREWGELLRVGGHMLAHFAKLNADAKPAFLRAAAGGAQ